MNEILGGHSPDYGNRAWLMPPLRERNPHWFGRGALIHRLAEARRRRIARNPKRKFNTHIKGSTMTLSQRSFTRRDLRKLYAAFNP